MNWITETKSSFGEDSLGNKKTRLALVVLLVEREETRPLTAAAISLC